MSFQALAWAASQTTGSLASKSALLALANYADEDGCAYPSTAAIAAFGEMDHKTATTALDRLIAGGFIADTGNRAGRTKQVKIYKLSLKSTPKAEAFQKRKPPVSEAKDPQKRGTDTVREPVPQKASPSSVRAKAKTERFRMPDDWKPVRFADDTVAREIIDRRGIEWARSALESFRNWAANADDRVGRKTDWQKAWANWVIEQDRRDGRGGRNGQRTATDRSDEITNPVLRAALRRKAAHAGGREDPGHRPALAHTG